MNTSGKQKTWIPVIILMLAGMLLIGGVSASEFAPWSVQTVDSGGNVGLYSSVALDAAGNTAMSYYDQTYGDLKYASWNGSKWVITTVDCSKSEGKNKWHFWNWGHDRTQDREYISCFHGTEKVGKYSSLAFDNNGNPRISFYDESKGDLKYASWDGSKWIVSTVDSAGKVGSFSSLAFDSNNKPSISYYDESKGNLKYASLNGIGWSIETVDGAREDKGRKNWDDDRDRVDDRSRKVGEYSSLAIDSSNKPAISYYDETNKNLMYAAWNGRIWVITTVDGLKKGEGQTKNHWDGDHHRIDDRSKTVGKYSSLALTNNNLPRISYYDQSNKNLMYAANDGTKWISITVDSSGRVGEFSSLALDVDSNPRISYYDGSHKDLKFTAWNSTTSQWVTETVDSSGKVGSFTSLALDLLGNPRISYYDQSNKDLKYAAGTGHVQNPTGPKVTSISPTSGPLSGNTTVTITGFRFTGATNVTFGTIDGTSLTFIDDNHISITSPAGTTAGKVDVTVTTPQGTSAQSPADKFTYIAAPIVSAISPAKGPVSGGTVVTIFGTGFTGATKVQFGTIEGTSLKFIDDTKINITSPAGTTEGKVDVTVTSLGGKSAISTADEFTYIAVPTVTGILPASGPLSGGTVVTLTGTGFTGATKVNFGTKLGTHLTFIDDNYISITSPAGTTAEPVDVTVTTPGGTSAPTTGSRFTYIAAPTITSILPVKGPLSGGTVVTLTGTGFTDATKVTFGIIDGTIATVSDTEISVTSPAGTTAGPVNVTVTTPGGTSAPTTGSRFTYIAAPTITSLSPASGPVSGDTIVNITGTGFTHDATVRFGTSLATDLTFINDTRISIISPDDITDRTIDVTVTTLGGTSAPSPGSRFTYIGVSTVTGISPSSGPVSGGTVVTITGTGLTGVTAVTFGGTTATVFSEIDETSITATTPAHAAGVVDVVVTTTNGAATRTNAYTYVAAPTVTSIEPATGVAGTQVLVTLTGDGFLPDATVELTKDVQTPVIAIPVSVDSTNKITCTFVLPASSEAAVGSWNVVVKNPDGQSGAMNGAFMVLYPDPTIFTITPLTSAADATVNMVITGKDFRYGQNPTIWLEKAGAISIPGTSINVIEPSTIKCSFILPKDTSIGDWSIMVKYTSGNPASKIGVFQVTPKITSSKTWDWSTANGWDGWSHTESWNGGVSYSVVGPLIDGDHGEYGLRLTAAESGGEIETTVWKEFTPTDGAKWDTLTFTGLLSSSDYPVRSMTIRVNGGNTNTYYVTGETFTITQKFTANAPYIIKISSIQNPTFDDTSYTMQFNSLTLSS